MVTTRPHCRSTIVGSAARVQCSTPYRFTRRNGSQSAGTDVRERHPGGESLGPGVARVVHQDVHGPGLL